MASTSHQPPGKQPPDAEQQEMPRGLELVLKYRTQLTVLAVVVVVMILLVNMNNARVTRIRQESTGLLSDAINSYSQLMVLSDIEQRQSQFDDVIGILNQLEIDYGDTLLGNEARYFRGKVFFAMDRFEEAQEHYRAYIEHAANDENRARGQIALGYSHENQAFLTDEPGEQHGKLDDASDNYTRAMKLSPAPSYIYYYALMGQARVSELTSRRAEAMSLYEEVLEGRPEPPVDEDEPDPRTLANPLDYVKWFIRKQQQAESFHTTAKLRLDRLRATTDDEELATVSLPEGS